MPSNAPVIPPHGSYFLSSSKMDNDPAYTCVTLYQIDRSAGLRLKAQANIKHSVPLADWLGDFEPALAWFSVREITVIPEHEALEIVAKNDAFDRILVCAKDQIAPTSFMVNDGLAYRNPQHSSGLVLAMAKLAKPLPLNGHVITHISKAGDFIYDLKAGLSSISYLEVSHQDLQAAAIHAEVSGFVALEKHLGQVKSVAKLRGVAN